MKKFAKMSLVAAVAVAGLTTTSSAKALEDAIKNVDVSGVVTYRYNDYEDNYDDKNGDGNKEHFSKSSNNYKISLNLKSKVNEDVTANTRFIIGGQNSASEASLSTHNDGDGQLNVTLSEVNFVYTGIANTSITFGKQALATPFTMARDSMGNEQTGTGALAVTNLGPVTLAAAYFNQTNLGGGNSDITKTYGEISDQLDVNDDKIGDITGDENVVFVGAMASFAGINIDASYIDLQDIADAYTVGLAASYNVGDVKLSPYVRYSSLDLDDTSADNKLFKVGINAQMGIFDAFLAYGHTDKEGGTTALDYSADTGMDPHWRVTLTGINDADAIYASIGAQVLPKLHVALKYSGIDTGSKTTGTGDQEEIYTKITYDMSKNFSTYLQFGQFTKDKASGSTDKDVDSTIGRLNVQYSF
ncbi:hypothetical protein CRU98_07935 [Arcobacter sp. CECT 8986]|uniref:porin n=1 Tax=Arcobacter sp. CECT 8986 TaxID=2044507 RepID=UPI001009B50A|nr:porin [Arcobacter sp. CECT 8986]RXJ99279.1 hypothetical protein CRU98_07935 [Arcobacter sp. CECT 8986]